MPTVAPAITTLETYVEHVKADLLHLVKLVLSAAVHKAHMVVVVRGSKGDLALASNPLYMAEACIALTRTLESWSDEFIDQGDTEAMTALLRDAVKPSTLDLDEWIAGINTRDVEDLLKEVQRGHGPGSEDLPQA